MDKIGMDISWQRKVFSYLLSALFIFRNKRNKELPKPKNILIIDWAYLGDIITATPSIRFLQNSFPNAKISLLTSPDNKQYINDIPFVDEIFYKTNPLHLKRTTFLRQNIFTLISFLRQKQYDIAIELTGRLSNHFFLFFIKASFKIGEDPTDNFFLLDKKICSKPKHEIERNIDIIKLITDNKNFDNDLWNPVNTDDVKFIIDNYFENKIIQSPFAIIHFCASWKPRVWDLNKWKVVCEHLLSKKRIIIFIGSQQEKTIIDSFLKKLNNINCLNLAGKLTIRQVIALMQRAELFVGNDSGPMHLSAIAGLKGIVLFGPGDPIKWSYPIHRVIYKQMSCNPCPQIAYKQKCSKGFYSCKALEEIKAEEVIAECDKLMNVKHI
jgi:ADP-heptose:LPS heptosyltransferase